MCGERPSRAGRSQNDRHPRTAREVLLVSDAVLNHAEQECELVGGDNHRCLWNRGFRCVDASVDLHDFNAPPTQWAAVPSTFHDFTYVAFERSGHYPFCVESELFDMALLEWLAAPRGTDP